MQLPGLLYNLKRWARQATIILMTTGVAIVAVNVAIYEVLVRFPQLEETKAARITRESDARLESLQREHATEWLAVTDPAELQAFFVERAEYSVTPLVYEDFTLFKPIPWKGRFFNFVDAGYRKVSDQGPWPPSKEYFNIFFFGGSTTMGVGPDWATVPSYLQAQLHTNHIKGKPARVYRARRVFFDAGAHPVSAVTVVKDRA
jgi:hypothetical protein